MNYSSVLLTESRYWYVCYYFWLIETFCPRKRLSCIILTKLIHLWSLSHSLLLIGIYHCFSKPSFCTGTRRIKCLPWARSGKRRSTYSLGFFRGPLTWAPVLTRFCTACTMRTVIPKMILILRITQRICSRWCGRPRTYIMTYWSTGPNPKPVSRRMCPTGPRLIKSETCGTYGSLGECYILYSIFGRSLLPNYPVLIGGCTRCCPYTTWWARSTGQL